MLRWLLLILLTLPGVAKSSETMARYLERYHRLPAKEIEPRLELASWCALNGLERQQAELLGEVLKLEPDHAAAYRDLIEVDGRRNRPVDPAWAARLQRLLGHPFRLHHALHFTILTDTDESAAAALGEALESAYAEFFQEFRRLGMRPMPPEERLVCIFFRHQAAYADFLRRFEGQEQAWSSGHYSWRTNRVTFFHDEDHRAFVEIRQAIAAAAGQIAEQRGQLEGETEEARRNLLEQQLRKLTASRAEMADRLAAAAKLATLMKTRHEAAHQLLFNSGIQRRGREYPAWLSEGLACGFEAADPAGRGGPATLNTYRLSGYRHLHKSGRLLPLDKLLEHRPAEGADAQDVADYYAQAWALVHFLWNQRPEELRNYLIDLDRADRPRDGMESFIRHFGPIEDLRPPLVEHLSRESGAPSAD